MSFPKIYKEPFSVDILFKDLEKGAKELNAPFCAEVTKKMLQAFEKEFTDGHIQFRVSSLDKSLLNYRILCLYDVDWLKRIEESNIFPSTFTENRAAKLLREVKTKFPQALYLGNDFDAVHGLKKVYMIFPKPILFDQLLTLQNLPPALTNDSKKLKGCGFNQVVICAVDFVSESVNIYFVWQNANVDWMQNFTKVMNTGEISRELCDTIIKSAPVHGSLATTWSYEKEQILRWCIYTLGLRYDRPEMYEKVGELAGCVLPERHERFLQFDKAVGSCTDKIAYGLGWSFGNPCPYCKYERSYTKDILKEYQTQIDSYD